MFYGTGMIHKGCHLVGDRRVACIASLGCDAEVCQPHSGNSNIKEFAVFLPGNPALLGKTVKAEVEQAEYPQNNKEDMSGAVQRRGSQGLYLLPCIIFESCFIFIFMRMD